MSVYRKLLVRGTSFQGWESAESSMALTPARGTGVPRRGDRRLRIRAGPGSRLGDLLERRVVEHEPPLGSVRGEAHGDDAAGLDARDDPFAERSVPHRVAGREGRHVLARGDGRGRTPVGAPRRGPERL